MILEGTSDVRKNGVQRSTLKNSNNDDIYLIRTNMRALECGTAVTGKVGEVDLHLRSPSSCSVFKG